MSKKVISVLLSVAIMATMLCVGFGMLTASADTVTYYFLAPDSYLSTNDTVGVYYWQPKEPAPWPGVAMEKAESIGKNVFSVTVGDNDETEYIIFNAFVDAGTPADPALAAVAHQTVNIELNGNDKYENFYGMIYVLANDADHRSVNEFSGAITGSGDWFSIDPSAPDYYKNDKIHYGSYGFPEENADDSAKEVHEGDTVKVSVTLGGVEKAGTLTSYVKFDKSLLEYTGTKTAKAEGQIVPNDSLSAEDGLENTLIVGAVFAAEGTDAFAGDPAEVMTFDFKALKNTTLADVKASVSQFAEEITKIEGDEVKDVYTNYNHVEEGNAFSGLAFEVVCPHKEESSSETSSTVSSETSSTTSSEVSSTVSSETSSTTSSETSSTTSSETSSTTSSETSSTTSSENSSNASGTSSTGSSSKASSSSSSSNKSSSTPSNGQAIQTAGTFAVVTLVVVLMLAGAAAVLYARKKTEE